MRMPLAKSSGIADDMKSVNTTLERLNDRDDVLGALGIRDRDLDSQRAGGRLDLARLNHVARIVETGQDCQAPQVRNDLA